MNKEEIEELKDFTIDITDIDELALGLEVCSKKSNMVIQEFADTIIQLQQENKRLKEINEEHKKLNGELREENKKYKEIIDKAIEYINDNLIISSILDGKKYYTINNYSFDYRELLDILKEVK